MNQNKHGGGVARGEEHSMSTRSDVGMAVAGAGGSAYSLMARSVVGVQGGFQVDPSAWQRQSSMSNSPHLHAGEVAGGAAEMVGRKLP